MDRIFEPVRPSFHPPFLNDRIVTERKAAALSVFIIFQALIQFHADILIFEFPVQGFIDRENRLVWMIDGVILDPQIHFRPAHANIAKAIALQHGVSPRRNQQDFQAAAFRQSEFSGALNAACANILINANIKAPRVSDQQRMTFLQKSHHPFGRPPLRAMALFPCDDKGRFGHGRNGDMLLRFPFLYGKIELQLARLAVLKEILFKTARAGFFKHAGRKPHVVKIVPAAADFRLAVIYNAGGVYVRKARAARFRHDFIAQPASDLFPVAPENPARDPAQRGNRFILNADCAGVVKTGDFPFRDGFRAYPDGKADLMKRKGVKMEMGIALPVFQRSHAHDAFELLMKCLLRLTAAFAGDDGQGHIRTLDFLTGI
ncbi:MAG TPA: hypothetical protein PKE04_05270 [Clostridia bacterium]|nr:hypothetical protein [Clostridia bacterium]